MSNAMSDEEENVNGTDVLLGGDGTNGQPSKKCMLAVSCYKLVTAVRGSKMIDFVSKDQLAVEEPVKTQRPSKIPIIAAGFFAALALGLLIALIVVVSNRNAQQTAYDDSKTKMCTSPGCVNAAAMVLEAMDQTVDPCEDFFEFSCGNWVKKNVIPEDKSSFTTFTKLRDQVALQLKALLEEPGSEDDPEAVTEIRDMYKACLDEDAIEALGYQPLHDLLGELGGWPMITPSWNESQFDLMQSLLELRLLNNRYFVNGYITVDYKNSSNHILKFSEFDFVLPSREYYLQSQYAPIVDAYKTYITDIATFFNGTSVERDVAEILELETFFANITKPKSQRRDPELTYNKMTIGEMYTNISDQFEWLTYINTLFSHVNYTFNLSSEIVITSPEYYQQVITKIKSADNRTLANYLLWRFTANRIRNLPKAVQNIKQKFNQALSGAKAEPPRWKTCTDYSSNFMGMASGRLFVRKHFNEEAKNSALEMISGVRDAFDELLDNVEWMNEATKKVAIEKSAAIHEKIGYPEWINNDTRLNEQYEGLLGKISPNRYFANHVRILQYWALEGLKLASKPVKKNEWSSSPTEVNAYYQGTENQITFPAGILQPPFWQKDRPQCMNYGAIGTVIGHEITHGFDDRGRKFDKDGNLVEWWDSDVIKSFDKAKQCIVDQYGSYVVPQLNRTLNGEITQGENIADNGGIKQSYRAYEKWQAKNGMDQRLPGLDYSPNQLFFIAFSQMWCSASRDNSLKLAIEEGVHSPGMFRIIGTLSNFPEFSKQYNCPAGSRMNPTKKCSVW